MSTLLSRIKEIAEKEGVSVGHIEKQIGASKGVLSRAIKNNTDIQAKWLQSIVENYPSYSALWLLTGEEKNHSLSDSTLTYGATCSRCEQKDQRIMDLLDTIATLKETNSALKELIQELKK